jgi:hypothetical protein
VIGTSHAKPRNHEDTKLTKITKKFSHRGTEPQRQVAVRPAKPAR